MKRTKDIETVIMDLLEHFHEDSLLFGGWPLLLKAKSIVDMVAVKKEFGDTLRFKLNRDKSDFWVSRNEGVPFKDAHTVLVLRERAESFKRESERLREGLKALLEG